jgi:hypothetical protein
VGSSCVTSAANPTGVVGVNCFPGTPTGDYGSGWTVRYVATPKPGYRFVQWQSDGSGSPVLCDGANGSSTYTGTACQFATFANLQVQAVFEDVTAPAMASLNGPSQAVNGSTAFSFGAVADPTLTGFECRVANVHDWTPCSSGRTENPANSGSYTFEVRAVDASGNRSAVSTWQWTVDKVAPETTLASGPSGSQPSASATFEFSTNESGGFQCALDTDTFTSCSSPTAYSALAQGEHRFRVRSFDQAGNVDVTPAERTWTVDTVAPETALTRAPAALVPSTSASFEFGSSEAGSFTCTLDGTASPCTSPVTYSGLAQGRHSFTVAATDAASNIDLTPAARSWVVDTVGPRARSVSPTGTRVARGSNVVVVFSEAMREATVEARRRGVPTTVTLQQGTRPVPASVTYRRSGSRWVAVLDPARALLPSAIYRAAVRSSARDLAGNRLATRSWTFRTRR